ncbi:VCBS repeat-containing protein [bacterium]|nr:VCBS repeat-containing protein [bacterium]
MSFRHNTPVRGLALLAVVGLLGAVSPGSARAQYAEEAQARGIDMIWSAVYAPGDLGSGLAMEDADHDGDLDIFVGTKRGFPLAVYRNDGDQFTALGDDLDLAADHDIKQVLFADLDNDGWRDLVLSLWQPDEIGTAFLSSTLRVYRGGPDFGFERRLDTAIDFEMVSLATGMSAGDIDRDGDLDLYVGVWKAGQASALAANRLLRNDGDFHFTDRGAALGVAGAKKTFQATLVDLSGDGWLDILTTEDKRGGVTYYESNGDGTFTERSRDSGLDGYVFTSGNYADGMGIAVGDYDDDLDLDVYITNIFDGNLMYRNNGDGTFTNVAPANGTVSLRVGWGCSYIDFDNDTRDDLFVVNFGMLGTADNGDRLYANQGNGTFVDIAAGAGIITDEDAFGMATGDVDGNGGIDLIVSQGRRPVRLYMNTGVSGNNWAALDLVGTDSNRDAVGAMVHVWSGGRQRLYTVMAGESYLSFNSHRIELGLGAATVIDSVAVDWPTGRRDTWRDLAAGQVHVLTETATAPDPPTWAARWDGSALAVSWRVLNPLRWSRFELWCTAPGPERLLGSLAALPGQSDYELRDRDAGAGTTYLLRAYRPEVATPTESDPIAPPAVALSALAVKHPRPNPFNPRVVLRYAAPAGADVRLRILDVRGREIVRLPAPVGDGWQSVTWDGRDASGGGVPSGQYFFEITAGGETRTERMTLVR